VGPRDFLLAEFDQEIAATRGLLVRLPEAAMAWRPHARSASLGGLADHFCHLMTWGVVILEREREELADAPPDPADPPVKSEVVERFDRLSAEVRRRLVSLVDAQCLEVWTLLRGTQAVMSLPRATAFRRFFLYHLVHHRGQLSVYLRLCDVPLPPLYGPTADEPS